MKRTILRSSKGKKLYAKRAKNGRFKDIQSYKRAHAADLRRKSRAEDKAFIANIERALSFVGVSHKQIERFKAAILRLAK